ncbi:hypothetical protein EJ06DRAFT_555199 [Trichodelitschia bisporula]|uniref:Uncharacterized protein n=1 Tax=Trichodelitschia bisporula TaxID=703511 RepID=A0A6G1I2V6_9PEZI|nr:hypothetical protein EJ06DRAFT_555199 [Trichodelitschia bisporula]
MEEPRDDSYPVVGASNITLTPINLTFNIPPGFQGPFCIQMQPKLDVTWIDASGQLRAVVRAQDMQTRVLTAPTQQATTKGFFALPNEIRNRIYSLLFCNAEKDGVTFRTPGHIRALPCIPPGLSAAFLRTCHEIYNQGRLVLYGNNTFEFSRSEEDRRPYFSHPAFEVVYRDFYHWTKTIGPLNLSLIRKLRVYCSNPRRRNYRHVSDPQRFCHDKHLLSALKLIAHNCHQLEFLHIRLSGRKLTWQNAPEFVQVLGDMRAEVVELRDDHYWNLTPAHYRDLEKAMTRVPPEDQSEE